MKNNLSVIVLGAGLFGTSVARKLFELDIDVMIVDKDEEVIQEIANDVTAAVQCNLVDEKAVTDLGLSNFDVAIICIGGDLEASVVATLAAKDNKVPKIIAKANSHTQARILRKLGANQVIFPEIDMGERLARSLSGNNVLEYLHTSSEYALLEIKAQSDWVDKSLSELDFYNKYNMNVIAYRRNKKIHFSNLSQFKIHASDELILIGKHEDAGQFQV
ncbi:MAG: TrkA family potassium uptake protein [Clostridiaceae bacterium]|jgi:trk system potassium uptake protein TrkA|nr:TrkA family potassium uptake protein [Clostridiaceae bacterium]